MATLEEMRAKAPSIKLGPFKFVMGGLRRITVAGAGSPAVDGTLIYGGELNGKPAFFNGTAGLVSGALAGDGVAVYWESSVWIIAVLTAGSPGVYYISHSAVASPESATSWLVWVISGLGHNPVPTVT